MSFFGFFNKVGGQEAFIKAYKNEHTNLIYNLLFCDNLKLYKDTYKGEIISPWLELFSNSKSLEQLEKIAGDSKNDSRIKILACYELLRLGIKPKKKELFGVIVEVGMDAGLDTLAVYVDNTARYINYSEKMIIWENADDAIINNKISKLFAESEQLVSKIGPWDKKRLPQPKRGDARISFLVSDGLYFGQGGFNFLSKDPLGGAVLNHASELMKTLVDKSLEK